MKRKNINKNDKTTDMELKALAKAFVESAVNEGYTASKIYSLTQQVWRETTAKMKENDKTKMEEMEYRKKVEEFVKCEQILVDSLYGNIEYEENGETKITNATIELICEMHKCFLSKENITALNLKKNVINRLKAITPCYFPATAETDRAYKRIGFFLRLTKRELSYIVAEEPSNLYNSYKFKNNSATEYILIMEWCINNNYGK